MEKVYVIQPIIDEDYRIEHEEIISLIESSDGIYAGTLYQKIREVNPATYIGEGKLSELKERLSGLDEITVLFNGALSPSQTLNISHVLVWAEVSEPAVRANRSWKPTADISADASTISKAN